MKALTIRQPYANLICQGVKDIENRSWKTNFRGTVLIHASASLAPGFIRSHRSFFTPEQQAVIKSNPLTNTGVDVYYGSSVIGKVDITDCVRDHGSVWAIPGQWHWVLENAVMFHDPIRDIKGRLSFWDYDGELPENGTRWEDTVTPGTHIAFGFDYRGGEPQKIVVGKVIETQPNKYLVISRYGHGTDMGMSGYVRPHEVLAVLDDKNGTHRIPGWGGMYRIVNPDHELAHVAVST